MFKAMNVAILIFGIVLNMVAVSFAQDDASVHREEYVEETHYAETSAPDRKLPALKPGEWEPLFELGESIYPSVAISTATLKTSIWDDKQHMGDPWGVIGIVARGNEANCPIRVSISGGNFVGPSVFTGVLPDKDTVYCVYPPLKYDYEKLLNVKQTVPETLSFKVIVGDKMSPEKSVRVQVRPVNECVSYFIDSSNGMNDVSILFAAYVNENHPFIKQILKEALASKKVESFGGYQGDENDVMSEIMAVWDVLRKRGVHYSTMPVSADDNDPYLNSQYVRLLGESIGYSQANCVDGTVLLASIFRKMGLNTGLVILPDHMFVSVDLDEKGKKTIFIETTLLGDSTLEEAMEEGYKQYAENKKRFESDKKEDEDYSMVDIQTARVAGVVPIKDSSAN